MGYDANDKEQVEKARKQAKFDEAIKFDEIKRWLGNPVGRQLMHDFLFWTLIWTTTFREGDPHGTSWQEGRRTAGLYWLAEIQAASGELYSQMVTEAKNRGKSK